MKILFIRHADAFAKDPVDDFYRRLSWKGIRDIRQYFPKLNPLFKQSDFIIYASPMIRAKETALLLSEIAQISTIKYKDYLAESDFELFLQDLKETNENLVIVGHEPTISNWIYRLTEQSLTINKASATLVEYGDEKRLRWSLDASQFSKLAYYHTTSPFKNDLKPIVCAAKERILQVADAYIHHADDPEALHDLRVNTRRYLSLLVFLKPYSDKKEYRDILKNLKCIIKLSGRMREFDVFKNQLDEENFEENKELLSKVDTSYQQLKDILLSQLSDSTYRQFMEDLDFLTIMMLEEEKKSLKEIAENYLSDLYLKISTEILQRDRMPIEKLHALRIKCKNLRYTSDLLGSIIDQKFQSYKRECKSIQELLGNVCDQNFISDIFESFQKES